MSYLFYFSLFALYLVFIFFFTKFRMSIGQYFNILDKPTKNKIHHEITPLIAAFPIFFFSLILLVLFNLYEINKEFNYIILISSIFFLIGYLDDRHDINAYLKLIVTSLFLLIVLNSTDNFIIKTLFFETFNKTVSLNIYSKAFSILCILLLINALNLSDGINGLASGIASLWFFVIFIFSDFIVEKNIYLILASMTFISSIFIYKGKYFLGDSGTLFLGSFVSLGFIYTYNIQFQNEYIISAEKIFILFMIPGIDMFRLFMLRIKKRKDPFSGDLNHLHHLIHKYLGTGKTLSIYLILFLSTNYLSFFNILKPITIIMSFLIVYVIFIVLEKKLNFFKIKN